MNLHACVLARALPPMIAIVMATGLCVSAWSQDASPNNNQQPPEEAPAAPAGQAPAADAPPTAPTFTFAPAREAALSPQQQTRLTRILTRTVLSDLRSLGEPRKEDYALAALMLKDAATLDPKDARVARRWVQAAHGAEDDAMVLEGTRMLIRTDPNDTVAQLRMITSRLGELQVARDRMDAYEKLLASSGGLDVSVRSRIALDAALLARDIGDEVNFVRMLKEATRLDSTNKDAAFLAYAYFSQRVEDDKGRLELLANLLMADPLDAGVHLQIRDLLAVHGAWEAAERFHRVGQRILEARNESDTQSRVETVSLGIARGQAATALTSVQQDLASAREQQRAAFDNAKTDNKEVSVLPPEDVRLNIPLEEARIAAAHACGDLNAASASISDLGKTTQLQLEVLQDPTRRPAEMTEAQAKEEVISSVYRLTMWRMLTGVEIDFAKTVATEIQEKLAGDDVRRTILSAWVALRSNEAVNVATLVDPVIEQGEGDEWAFLVRALAEESLTNRAKAASRLRAFAAGQPFTPCGAWASWKADQLELRPLSSMASALAQYTKTIPNWVDQMITNPDTFQRLSLSQPATGDVLDAPGLTLSIRNMTSVPMSLGEDRTINSRVLLGPRVDTPRGFPDGLVEGEVVELNQRLRLNPGEQISVVFWPSETPLGWVLDTVSDQTTRLRYRALQGFQIDEEGIRYAPAGSLDRSSSVMQLTNLEEAKLEPASLARRVLEASEARIPTLLIATRSMITRLAVDAQGSQDLLAVTEAWARKLPTLPPTLRMLALVELPNRLEFEGMSVFDRVAYEDPDPMVQRWNVFARVSALADPTLEKMLKTEDPTLLRVAQAQKERIESNLRIYSAGGMLGRTVSKPATDNKPTGEAAPK